jgi:cytochrome c-type biogenesis protein CcmH/NrfG
MKTKVILSAVLLVLLGAIVVWQTLDEMEDQKRHEESLRKHRMGQSMACKYAPSLEARRVELLTMVEVVKEELARTDDPDRQEELRRKLQKSKARLDDLAFGFAHVGDACFGLGELDKATEAIRKAISLDPENVTFRALLKKVEQTKQVNP